VEAKNQGTIIMLRDDLVEFCQSIDVSLDEIEKAETPTKFVLKTDILVENLKKVSLEDWQSLIDTFGKALSILIGVEEAPLFQIVDGNVAIDPNKAISLIQRRDDTAILEFQLTLLKKAMLSKFDLSIDHINGFYFFFKKNLMNFLKSSLLQIDQRLFQGPLRQTVIVISESDLNWAGPLLTIISEDKLNNEINDLEPLTIRIKQRVDKYLETAIESLSWVGFKFENLTPLHFIHYAQGDENAEISSILSSHLLRTSMIYTANRTSVEGNEFTVFYSSSEQTTAISLDSAELSDNYEVIVQNALWPYSGKETDRLIVYQNVVAREITGDNPDQNFITFIDRIRHILTEARWHYRVFLDGEVNRHFEQIQQVNNYINGVTQEVSKTIDVVTKSVTDTLLATVAVIVLTLLASLVKSEIQSLIFRISMRAYAVYLLLFQGLYRMGSILHSYRLLTRETDEQFDYYSQILVTSKIRKLLAPLDRRKNQFVIWFVVSLLIYAGIIVLIWILADQLPAYLQNSGVAVPSAQTPVSSLVSIILTLALQLIR
jgi:hypothetical protein